MPYRYAINNSTFTNQIRYNQLSPGLNELVVVDANMCTTSESQELIAAEIPVIVGFSSYEVALGCEIELNVNVNDISVQSIQWEDDSYLDCGDCLDPIATPITSLENRLFVTSEDGCIDTFSIACLLYTSPSPRDS